MKVSSRMRPKALPRPRKTPADNVPETNEITYYLNDITSDLKIKIPVPEEPKNLSFKVQKYAPNKDFPFGSAECQATNCYITVYKTIEYFQSILTRFRPPVQKWTATQTLNVIPRAGKALNAYCDRRNLKFFYEVDTNAKKIVFLCESTDIVSHELGHALLDCIRPDLWNVQCLEIWAFHEGWSDIIAILSLMQFDIVLEKTLNETDGDLKISNLLSKIAEELGQTVYNVSSKKAGYNPKFLRNAVNSFAYTPPESLPKSSPDDKLSQDPHNFGRVFLGAWYDILVGIYEQNVQEGQDRLTALKNARDTAALYLMKAVVQVPKVVKFFNAVAQNMITVDKDAGEKYGKILVDAFTQRGILSHQLFVLTDNSLEDIKGKVNKGDNIISGQNSTVVRLNGKNTIKLADHRLSILSDNKDELSQLDIEIPDDVGYKFNNDGQMLSILSSDFNEILESADACLAWIKENNKFGKYSDTMWGKEDNKLVRTYVECGCPSFLKAPLVH